MAVVTGSRTVYGLALGVIMLDTTFPRVLGDVGNAGTWPFPVAYRVVEGAFATRVARPDPDPALLEPFVQAARDLESLGVRAIVTSCGFLAIHQRELAAAVSVPVFSSSLLQVPLAATVIQPGQRVAILTVDGSLTERHFAGAGWSSADIPVVQFTPPPDGMFVKVFSDLTDEADPDAIDEEIALTVATFLSDHSDIGAIVMECTNLVPFAQSVRRVAQVPVFDFYTLGMHAFLTTVGHDFPR